MGRAGWPACLLPGSRVGAHTLRPIGRRVLASLLLATPVRAADLAGRVLDPAGKPLAGVTVAFVPDNDPPKVSASAVTDAAGRFRFERSPALLGLTAWPEGYRPDRRLGRCWVDAPGYALAWCEPTGDGRPEDIRLGLPAALDVPFVDGEHRPIAGLAVRIAWFSFRFRQGRTGSGYAFGVPARLFARLRAVTDAKGLAHFSGLPRGVSFCFDVDDPAYARLGDGRDEDERATGPVERTVATALVLPAAASLAGRVVDEAGHPMPGLRVSWPQTSHGWPNVPSALTDADGRYRLERLRPGTGILALELTGEQAAQGCAPAKLGVSVDEGQAREGLDFTFSAGTPLTIRVQATDGKRLTDASVTVGRPGDEEAQRWEDYRTGPNGVLVVRTWPGRHRLYVHADLDAYNQSGERTVEVQAGQPARLIVALPPHRRYPIHVRVLGPDGKPVAGAAIFAEQGPGSAFAQSGADGRGDVLMQEPAMPCRVRASRLPLCSPKWVPAKPGDSVTLVLAKLPVGRIEATVVGPDGTPMPGVAVTLMNDDGGWGEGTATTDAAGKAVFADRPVGRYDLSVDVPGFAHVWAAGLALHAGETLVHEPLKLRRNDQHVAGWVLDAAGKPVADAQVSANTGHDVRTNERGEFRLEGLVAGRCQVEAFKGDQAGHVEVEAGDENAVIWLSGRIGK